MSVSVTNRVVPLGERTKTSFYAIWFRKEQCPYNCDEDTVIDWGHPTLPEGVYVRACIRHAPHALCKHLGLDRPTVKEACKPRFFLYRDGEFSIGVHDNVNVVTWQIYKFGCSSRLDHPMKSHGAFYDGVEGKPGAWEWAKQSCMAAFDAHEEHFEKLMKEIKEELDEEERQKQG